MEDKFRHFEEVDITLRIKSNVDYAQTANLMGNPFNPLDTSNATTQYQWDLTSFVFTTETYVTLQYRDKNQPSFSLFTQNLLSQSLASVVDALNLLGLGFFYTYTSGGSTYIATSNNQYVFGDLSIEPTGGGTTTTTTTSTTTAAPTSTTTTSTTTAAPTSTTTTTSTTTAAPTSTTTTTSTTTAAPTSTTTTTSTTTDASTTTTTTTSTTTQASTTTTTTTTTLAPASFSLGYSVTTGNDACQNAISSPTTYYAANGSLFVAGTVLYTDPGLTILAPDDYYSDGITWFLITSGNGVLTGGTPCGLTTTTTTSTTTAASTTTTTSTTTSASINCTQWTNQSGVDAFYDWNDCDGTLHLNEAIPNNISICAQDGTVSFISGGTLTQGGTCGVFPSTTTTTSTTTAASTTTTTTSTTTAAIFVYDAEERFCNNCGFNAGNVVVFSYTPITIFDFAIPVGSPTPVVLSYKIIGSSVGVPTQEVVPAGATCLDACNSLTSTTTTTSTTSTTTAVPPP